VLAKWGNVLADVRKESSVPKEMRCHNSAGKVLIHQDLPPDYDGSPNVYTNRGRTQKIIYEHAVSLGIEVNFGCRVTDFFEDENGAGVVVNNGEKYTADAVLVGDGIHSRARRVITGKIESAKPSGFAVYRSWFTLDALKGEPLLEDIVNSKEDLFLVWIGPDTHAIVLTNVQLNYLVCFCTHKV
jgi:2-polyprenyl-6-methoxyphenol hydroxylase-like FAD-dependent oxidoreductase